MKSNHTEGKWYVSDIEQEDGEYIYTSLNQYNAIARVYKGDSPHADKAEANAKLIASAPELLRQRNELLGVLKRTVALYRHFPIEGYLEPYKQTWIDVDNAINSCNKEISDSITETNNTNNEK